VSKVTITSKVAGSDLAYTADFMNGVMVDEDAPKPCAGQQGTNIQVKDLFANNPQRKKSMGLNEEYAKIVDVVTKYAVHYPMIKFSCRKMDDKKTDVSTHNIPRPFLEDGGFKDLEKQKNLIRQEVIRKTYGPNTAGKEFLNVEDGLESFRYNISAIMSKSN